MTTLSHGSRLDINHDAPGALAAMAKLRDTVATIVDDGLYGPGKTRIVSRCGRRTELARAKRRSMDRRRV
jgi:hypothetical protein